jgi:predicted transcriptional regulator
MPLQSFQDVTETELAVLQELWDRGALTIRQIAEHLYPGGGTAHYATVQKLLDRLETKGFVQRERTAPSHRFHPVVAREELIGRRLRVMAEQLCGGSLTPVLTHLVRTESISPQERHELRSLIEQMERDARSHSHSPKTR